MIPADAITAAAEALEKADGWMYDRSMYRRMATIALEAATPHIRAQALEDAADFLITQAPSDSANQAAATWLRERVERIRPTP